ncbi:MAG: hypothetical protein ABI723_03800 [Bacteroidia bacterium]
MEIVLLPFAIAMLLAPPFMSAIMARSFGRPYWNWFFIGCCLPLIANVILAFLPLPKKKNCQ